MICPRCHGHDPLCPECGGCGFAYCCDGLQEHQMSAKSQKDYPDDTWARDVCKAKQGAACCRYLTLGGDPVGWSCAKHSWLRSFIDNRVALGTMKARGDNCPGKDMR
jgi:hypothetical protein